MTAFYQIGNGFHRFLYNPTPKSKAFLLNHLPKGKKWRIIGFFIKHGKPGFIPFKRIELNEPGDLILYGFQKKVFDFDNCKVYTSAFDEKGQKDLERSIKIKKLAGNSLFTSKILSWDGKILVEELITTHPAKISDLETVFASLVAFYKHNEIKTSTFAAEANKIDEKLNNYVWKNGGIVETIEKAMNMLKNRKEPCYLCLNHGDFHLRNIGIHYACGCPLAKYPYIFDLGSARLGGLLDDLTWLGLVDGLPKSQFYNLAGQIIREFGTNSIPDGIVSHETIDLYHTLALLKIIERELTLENKVNKISMAAEKLKEIIK